VVNQPDTKHVHGPEWTILLIGGNSSAGKTTLAQSLGRRFGVPWFQADDVRLALQHLTTPDHQPSLHFFVSSPGIAKSDVWALPTERLCRGLIEVGSVVSTALEMVIAHHLATAKPLIIEGDGIMPFLPARQRFADIEPEAGSIRSLFIVELDEDALMANLRGRGRGYDDKTREEQQTQVRMNCLFGEWLTQEAPRYGLDVLPAQPWQDLQARVERSLQWSR